MELSRSSFPYFLLTCQNVWGEKGLKSHAAFVVSAVSVWEQSCEQSAGGLEAGRIWHRCVYYF